MQNDNRVGLALGLALVAIVIAIIAVASVFLVKSTAPTVGSVGSRFPNGLSANNTSPVAGQLLGTTANVSGLVGFGSSTPSTLGDVVMDGAATTTLFIASSGSGGGCLQLENSAGTQTKAYIAGTSWVIAAGSCK